MTDALPPDAPPAAATVVLLRDAAAGGVEALMLLRPDHGSFARAWVFPGGRVDPGDGDARTDAAAVAAGVRETREETSLELLPDDLVPLSRWSPPLGIPRRFDTWFFVARAPEGEIVLSPDEAVDHRWISAADALRLHAEDALSLVPPTWVTLHELASHESVESALDAVRATPTPRLATVRDEEHGMLLWPSDERYAGGAETASGARHRLTITELPWVYERRG